MLQNSAVKLFSHSWWYQLNQNLPFLICQDYEPCMRTTAVCLYLIFLAIIENVEFFLCLLNVEVFQVPIDAQKLTNHPKIK